MSVTINRKNDLFRGFTHLNIKLNEEVVAKIGAGEQKKIEVPEEGAKLTVDQFGGRSNVLPVKDGDFIEVSAAPWTYWVFVLIFILPMIGSNLTENYAVGMGSIILSAVLYFAAFLLLESFQLRKRVTVRKR